MESPTYGGWGGRYVKVRDNTWLDPVPFEGYAHPEGRWYTKSAWGRGYMRETYPENQEQMHEYFKPITRWVDALQSDFAARADWCVKPFEEANHEPVVKLNHDLDMEVKPGDTIELSAKDTYDPDGDELSYNWWFYKEASDYKNEFEIRNSNKQDANLIVPDDAQKGQSIHIICEVKDSGEPQLTRYKRVIMVVE